MKQEADDFRFQISDFRCLEAEARRQMISDFRFQISDVWRQKELKANN
jgi:hypothetical protein